MEETVKELYSLVPLYERIFTMDRSLKAFFSKIPLFEGENQDRVAAHLMECPIVTYAPGDYILRNGEFDENCCILMVGKAKVSISGDWPDQTMEKIITEGDFFGEIAVLSGVPRTADITAEETCAVMQIPKEKMFELLDEFPLVRARIEETYRRRILNRQLRKVPIFSGLPEKALDALKDKAIIQVYKKGDVIFRQGDPADAIYLILFGFVKVSTTNHRGVRTLAYLKGEQHFGEMALLEEKASRMATVTAINRTHLVRISRDDFMEFLGGRPELKEAFKEISRRRDDISKKMEGDMHLADTLEATIEAGIIHARSTHMLDITKCVQCGICVESCARLHDGVSRLVRRGVRLNGFMMAVTSCRHCEDPACMYKCPTGAIARDPSGEIYHKSFCVGCGMCVKSCPYDSLTLVEIKSPGKKGAFSRLKTALKKLTSAGGSQPELTDSGRDIHLSGRLKKTGKKVVRCDMCGGYEFLGCVYNCPTGAMTLINPSEYFSELIPDE